MQHLTIGMELLHHAVPMRLLYRVRSDPSGELWCVKRIMVANQWQHDEFFGNREHVRLLHTRVMRVGGSDA